MKSLRARGSALSSAAGQVRLLETTRVVPRFDDTLAAADLHPLCATGIAVLQINVGKLCNQTCRHCHVDAGPDRVEVMSRETAELCMAALARTDIPTVDLTGGAPELNPVFRYLVEESKRLGRRVMDRCNLSVLLLPSQVDLGGFLARHRVEVVASLPSVVPTQTDAQRGSGVFEKSIEALRLLNALGYGRSGSGRVLTLVTNPVGAFLPPAQESQERQFRQRLARDHGVVFNDLHTITNMPISRFLEFLLESGNYEGYMQRLADAFNPAAAARVMCRYTLSVGWDGRLYDCDFNQMLELALGHGAPGHIRDFDPATLHARRIITGNHCYGCTAGAGSSCGGATA
ncbi:MAG TPA: arsenosugar biosynthesis radical SAM (seleno)protein ArsS [Candidatus Dormibacteraeota bacterium]|nr:arsenosugar biosynthesis radical SAM (seleno)protein ArsS [Candidatus Dormibacteraeota bacterium]